MTNIIAPYRLPIYDLIGQETDLCIFTSGDESNREYWKSTAASNLPYTVKKSWGITLKRMQKTEGKAFYPRYLHLTPGYFFDLLRTRPDVVISIEMGFRTLAALTYGKLTRKPVWVWWGGTLETEKNIGSRKLKLRRYISKRVKYWFTYGTTSTEYLLSLGVPSSRIVQLQNCVDHRNFHSDADPTFSIEQKPVVLHVGQLVNLKGVDYLLNAAAKLQKEGLVFSLLFVGAGPEKERLKTLATNLGLKNVHWEPPRKPNEMSGVYRSGDVLVFPTLADVWGLVANEALLCGVPVLCSKFAGCHAEIIPVENVFDPTHAEEFEAKLRLAIKGEFASADASKLLTFETIARRILNAISV